MKVIIMLSARRVRMCGYVFMHGFHAQCVMDGRSGLRSMLAGLSKAVVMSSDIFFVEFTTQIMCNCVYILRT